MHMMTWTNTILPQLRIFPSFIYTYTRNYSLYACALQNQHTAYYSAAVRRRAERPIMSLEERLGPTLTNLLPTAPILVSVTCYLARQPTRGERHNEDLTMPPSILE